MSPTGYREAAVGGTLVVARDAEFDALREIVASGTIHGWASRQPGARALQGRGVAWAVTLATGAEVVVRHSRHGGMLAALTGDLFLTPTRAPHELEVSLRLRDAGVPTPEVVAYAVYGAVGPLRRADVVTALVNGTDLPGALALHRGRTERQTISTAVSRLIDVMWKAGVRHPDLNAKNIIIERRDELFEACVIDVDRVTFHGQRNAAAAMRNVQRLVHSLLQWEATLQLDIAAYDMTRMSGFGAGGGEITPPAQ